MTLFRMFRLHSAHQARHDQGRSQASNASLACLGMGEQEERNAQLCRGCNRQPARRKPIRDLVVDSWRSAPSLRAVLIDEHNYPELACLSVVPRQPVCATDASDQEPLDSRIVCTDGTSKEGGNTSTGCAAATTGKGRPYRASHGYRGVTDRADEC